MKAPAFHVCEFAQTGFPWANHSGRAHPCGVRYHAKCIQVGTPFTTRLEKNESLIYPWHAPTPHYVCEICSVRAHVDRELFPQSSDIALTMVERVRHVDYMGGWSTSTLKKYGPYLRYLQRFERQFGVRVILRHPSYNHPSPQHTLSTGHNNCTLSVRPVDATANLTRFDLPPYGKFDLRLLGTIPKLLPCNFLAK
jgi:hypothetical protein